MTLELAEEFLLRGWHVDVYTNLFLSPMAERFAALGGLGGGTLRVADDPYDDFGLDYDLIWVQHSLLPPSIIRRLAERETRTPIVWHHMSALAEIELPLVADIENDLSDLETYVSESTRELQRPYGLTEPSLIIANPVPRRFTEPSARADAPPAPDLARPARIAVVSNHPPQEVLDAAAVLRGLDVEVDVIGEATEVREITPELLAAYDGVVTIGKTVQYALSLGVPVYVYDHFGGEGWLAPDNDAAQAATNYSGRATGRRIDGDAIAAEIVDGFAAAGEFARERRAQHAERFSLRRSIDGLLSHPAIVDPAPKRLTEAQSLRWLALSEQLRGMYRTLEHLTDELARTSAEPAAIDPAIETAAEQTPAPAGLVHVFVATADDPLATARASASVAQQRLAPDRVTTPEHTGLQSSAVTEVDVRSSVARFNELVVEVATEFVAIQDGTASWHPDFLAAAVDHLDAHPEEAAVVAPAARTVERVVNGHRVEIEHHPLPRSTPGRHDVIDVSDQLVANRTPFGAMVFRRSAAVAAGLLDGDLRFAMDWDFGLRLLHVGPIGILDGSTALVTFHLDDDEAVAGSDARARNELAAKAMRLDGGRRLMYSAVLTSQAAAANVDRSAISERIDDLASTLRARAAEPTEGIELRVRRYLRRLPARLARRLPMRAGVRR
ncbi:hypothetical protein [Agromyces mariniharenae]|uniref:Uncharacterized protein n=1 Tax=Agromyces mariniharenae TaxID=2604423 RepID=A0A5S4V417_9MICO|nr:hypothetical protein [Agromyces mariniharenae]TYL52583.1 hypothetical protein FYC51_02165 [Agromyces mariniharenae]